MVGTGREQTTMRVTFSKEGLATYRSEQDETEVLLPRDESSFTLRLISLFRVEYSYGQHCSPMGSEFEGWDNPFTEGGTISRDAEVILR